MKAEFESRTAVKKEVLQVKLEGESQSMLFIKADGGGGGGMKKLQFTG